MRRVTEHLGRGSAVPSFKLPVGLAMAATLTNMSGLAIFAGFWPAHAEPQIVVSAVNPVGSVETLQRPDVHTPALQSPVSSSCVLGDPEYDNIVCILMQIQKTTAREAREDLKTQKAEKQQGETASQRAFEGDVSLGEVGGQEGNAEASAIQNSLHDLPRAKSPTVDEQSQLPVNASDADDSSMPSTAREPTIAGACSQAGVNCPDPCKMPPCQ